MYLLRQSSAWRLPIAALGAAILASVTDGEDMAAMQNVFCLPAEDSCIEPTQGVSYDAALAGFVDLLSGKSS